MSQDNIQHRAELCPFLLIPEGYYTKKDFHLGRVFNFFFFFFFFFTHGIISTNPIRKEEYTSLMLNMSVVP